MFLSRSPDLIDNFHHEIIPLENVESRSCLTKSPLNGVIDSNSVAENGSTKKDDLSTRTTTFQPISIEWQDLSVSCRPVNSLFRSSSSSDYIPIIRNVSGYINSGHLLAVMGASGAGKTTFLNVLTGRNLRNLDVYGKVLLNGQVSTADKTAAVSAYVQQDDMFIGVLTVREHLLFQANLRTNDSSPKKILEKVDNVIFELGLQKIENSRIGSPGMDKSISGGEMKRLAFASEILTDPSILFCDEPTSGLDSFMAQSVVTVLKSMAATRRTVIATIHQPSSEVFEMFDEILLLSQGRVAFMGSSSDALIFFSQIGLQCPQNYNPADFYIQQLAIAPGREEESRKKVEEICYRFSESQFSPINKLKQPVDEVDEGYKSKLIFAYKRGYISQMNWVLWRSWITNLRDPLLTSVRIAQTISIALLIGIIYWNQEYNQESIMNLNGALFILIANVSYASVLAVVHTFCLELPIFGREYGNGLYSIGVYFTSKTLAELPYFILLPFTFTTITYWMIGLYSDTQVFILAAFVLTLIANVACGFGYFISCISASVTMALSVAPPFITPLMLFGGLFLNNKSIPIYLEWIKSLSWFYYGNEILVVNQWRKVTNISCDISKAIRSDIYDSLNMTKLEPDNPKELNHVDYGCILNGRQVINSLDFEENNITRNLMALTIMTIAFRTMAFLCLCLKARFLK